MMTPEINALLTRVEKGAPMGRLLKEYWVPACHSAKLEAEGAPAFGKWWATRTTSTPTTWAGRRTSGSRTARP